MYNPVKRLFLEMYYPLYTMNYGKWAAFAVSLCLAATFLLLNIYSIAQLMATFGNAQWLLNAFAFPRLLIVIAAALIIIFLNLLPLGYTLRDRKRKVKLHPKGLTVYMVMTIVIFVLMLVTMDNQ